MSRKLLSFVMLFAVTFCFIGGCKDKDDEEQAVLVKDGKEVIATINGVSYTADDVYNDFLDSNTSAEYLYEELEDLLIKTVVPVTESMRNRITNEVEKWKKDIKENATINGTSYKDALASALKEENVSSEDELIEKKIFELQEEILTNQYWNANKENYYNSYLNNRYVYHISQILVSFSTNGNYDYFNVDASSSKTKQLYDVVNLLLNGESFYNVALKYSDDSNSKNNGGDLGIVSLYDTTISDEVKYALASYSVYFENANISYPEYLNTTYGNGIEAIPQEYVELLVKEDENGKKLYEDGSTYYISSSSSWLKSSDRVLGRKVIFNNLFNSRTFRFIQSSETSESVESFDNIRMPKEDSYGFDEKSTQNILVNDQGLPILVVRSDAGIHFISINKSAFVGEEELQKYYSKEVNETDDYITYLEKSINESDKTSRLEVLESFANDYATLAISNNSDFKGNENFIRYDMFNSYLGKTYNGVTFNITNEKIKNIINQYITSKKGYVQERINNLFSENYETYANLAEYSDNPLITKQIPILKCLEKECVYTYTNGFELPESSS